MSALKLQYLKTFERDRCTANKAKIEKFDPNNTNTKYVCKI